MPYRNREGLMPSPAILDRLGDSLQEGVLLFSGSGTLAYANPAASALCQDCPPGGTDGSLTLEALLPRDALPQARAEGRWSGHLSFGKDSILLVHAYYCPDEGGWYLVLLTDLRKVQVYEQDLLRRHAELNVRLTAAQAKLLQAEKLASIGQLAAGVAHEINNPIGYVHSNLGSLQEYLHSLFALIDAYERALRSPDPRAMLAEIDQTRSRLDIDFIARDLPQLMTESREGIERVTRIVKDLKDFSRSERDESWKLVDLHAGLESTLNIIWNELKYHATLEKDYGQLPPVECLPSELNQVFMNILINAGQAIGERGTIRISTGHAGDEAWVEIADSGPGIPPEVMQRIFDPFFTTKPVGKGTGLGLSISYGIVAKHHGRIDVDSQPGQGSKFRIVLPVRQPRAAA
ncbi:two-component sensor histidine kinase [Pseudoxanthomonas sp. SGNA-20]|uniref:histidine kinase n=2 Tax=Pseudoxanthomonas TaxID=83618 RepID=A0A562DIW3_9GAMM|nr:ATP-binding protein [Pseudoxanthomonas taiwanensis]RRN55383.1 two-component sensor histidine kinase [Pseudoxanthomonas sp. SGNA-20]RRN78582.1 two-component sensor histidine kinase [Pseudoxanthomonas sp. SGD-10]TWH09592.1 histidine kinase [Pseudoxanthomonas taiwanensis J19]